MSFGLSGDVTKNVMIGGDVVVAWVDKQTLKGYAEDYYLEGKSQCSGRTGSCPDVRLGDNTDSVRLLNAAMVNGYSIVTCQRPLYASDQFDLPIYTNRSQAIIWAIGPLNERNEVSFHSRYLKKTHLIDFGRPARWNCPMPEIEQPMAVVPSIYAQSSPANVKPPSSSSEEDYYEEPTTPKRVNGRRRGPQRVSSTYQESVEDSQNSASKPKEQARPNRRRPSQKEHEPPAFRPTQTNLTKRDSWAIPPIQCDEPEDGVFYAQMGPTGGKKGYPAITGHVGWGISWYINGLLIPEIYVVRGRTYNFVVEGGLDPEVSAKYHPFYITDDPVGGYEYKTPEEKRKVRVFAGTRKLKDGSVGPTGTGRLCHWTQTGDMDADDFPSFGAYQRVLELKCDPGEPGIVEWTPDKDTPDTVYYQCFTHRYLGWKIHVLDSCDEQPAASDNIPSILPAPESFSDKLDTDLEDSPSLRVETRVKQFNIIKEDNEDKDTKSIISDKVISSTLPMPSEQLPFLNPPQSPAPPFQPIHTRTRPNFLSYQLQQPQNLHYFKPSTLINTGIENIKMFSMPSTTTSTSTTSTTTEKSTTTRLEDNLAVASDHFINQTYLVPPPMPQYRDNVIYRRPVSYMTVPIKVMIPGGVRHHNLPHISYKKPVIRVPNHRYKPNISPYVIYSRAPVITKSPIENQVRPFTEKPKIEEVKNIEISPQQPSTEREPEIQTAPSSSITDIAPNFLLPAFNSGFKPGSIKVETGFKPIITKEFQDRSDKDEPIVEYESEKGVIQINDTDKYETKNVQLFEPMFIPSPTFKPTKEKKIKITKRPLNKKRSEYTKIVVKRPRSLKDDEEPIAEANERVESYYLPPSNAQPIEVVREPSNIDIDLPDPNPMLGTPPDVVITFDGKKLSGQSLTAKLSDRPSVINQRLSKASAYITARPQVGRYRGELPPLDIDYINKNAPQLQSSAGVINRELDTPLPSDNDKVVSTRLSRVN